VCGTEAQQIAALLGLTDGIPVPITPDGDLAQPIALPGTTPVGMFGGQPRYVSLAALTLPTLADGQRFGSFELILAENGFNFAVESPALRSAVLAAVSQAEDQDPEKIAAAVQEALTGEVPLATQTLTGIEACPITDPWNAGRAQGANLDGSRLPRVSCLSGTTGVFDDKTRTWHFDLTFAVQAWTESGDGDKLENQGVMFRPLGAPNFAYGDPDFSTNWVVSLADSTNDDVNLRPRIKYTTVLDENDVVPDLGDDLALPDLGLGDGSIDVGGGSLGGDITGGAGSGGRGNGGGSVKHPRTIATHASTPGWVWIVLPLLVLGAYLFDQSLIATPALLRRRPGALTQMEMNREKEE
jgi:hypothetical protein